VDYLNVLSQHLPGDQGNPGEIFARMAGLLAENLTRGIPEYRVAEW
jgi:hypothetical protein